MAISYPLSLPTTAGIARVTMGMKQASISSGSPFTFKRQVFAYPGKMWTASVSLPPGDRDDMAPWVAFLASLKGVEGSFLLGDPNYATARGTVSSCSVTGSTGDETVSVTMTGSLLAGDYIQLGAGQAAELYMVLQDQTGTGNLEIWPPLRSDHTAQAAIFDAAKGVFSLSGNTQTWDIDKASIYGISFEAVEVIAG